MISPIQMRHFGAVSKQRAHLTHGCGVRGGAAVSTAQAQEQQRRRRRHERVAPLASLDMSIGEPSALDSASGTAIAPSVAIVAGATSITHASPLRSETPTLSECDQISDLVDDSLFEITSIGCLSSSIIKHQNGQHHHTVQQQQHETVSTMNDDRNNDNVDDNTSDQRRQQQQQQQQLHEPAQLLSTRNIYAKPIEELISQVAIVANYKAHDYSCTSSTPASTRNLALQSSADQRQQQQQQQQQERRTLSTTLGIPSITVDSPTRRPSVSIPPPPPPPSSSSSSPSGRDQPAIEVKSNGPDVDGALDNGANSGDELSGVHSSDMRGGNDALEGTVDHVSVQARADTAPRSRPARQRSSRRRKAKCCRNENAGASSSAQAPESIAALPASGSNRNMSPSAQTSSQTRPAEASERSINGTLGKIARNLFGKFRFGARRSRRARGELNDNRGAANSSLIVSDNNTDNSNIDQRSSVNIETSGSRQTEAKESGESTARSRRRRKCCGCKHRSKQTGATTSSRSSAPSAQSNTPDTSAKTGPSSRARDSIYVTNRRRHRQHQQQERTSGDAELLIDLSIGARHGPDRCRHNLQHAASSGGGGNNDNNNKQTCPAKRSKSTKENQPAASNNKQTKVQFNMPCSVRFLPPNKLDHSANGLIHTPPPPASTRPRPSIIKSAQRERPADTCASIVESDKLAPAQDERQESKVTNAPTQTSENICQSSMIAGQQDDDQASTSTEPVCRINDNNNKSSSYSQTDDDPNLKKLLDIYANDDSLVENLNLKLKLNLDVSEPIWKFDEADAAMIASSSMRKLTGEAGDGSGANTNNNNNNGCGSSANGSNAAQHDESHESDKQEAKLSN